jgi:hypothetical protein
VARDAPPEKGEDPMNDNAGDRHGPRGRSRPWRAGLLVAATSVPLLAAACGGAPAAAPSAHLGGLTAEVVDAFALCVRDHGVAGFYVSRTVGQRYNGQGLNLAGWHSTPVTPGSPVLQSALKACTHVLGLHGGNPTATSAQLRGAVKSAECMRAHGYPDYPDPLEQGGQVTEPALPASIDTSSPQFQSATEACNASP